VIFVTSRPAPCNVMRHLLLGTTTLSLRQSQHYCYQSTIPAEWANGKEK
jgi:hypothetical protein